MPRLQVAWEAEEEFTRGKKRERRSGQKGQRVQQPERLRLIVIEMLLLFTGSTISRTGRKSGAGGERVLGHSATRRTRF